MSWTIQLVGSKDDSSSSVGLDLGALNKCPSPVLTMANGTRISENEALSIRIFKRNLSTDDFDA